jgi:hypothetical protein
VRILNIILLISTLIISGCAGKQAISDGKIAQQLCNLDRKEKTVLVPARYFKEYKILECSFGKYQFSVQKDIKDEGHSLFLIAPSHGIKKAYDCDSKADNSINKIAMNCLLVNYGAPIANK